MNKKYGYFNPETREYVITDPMTPEPWINYLYGDSPLSAFVSNGAGGMLWHEQPHTGRLTRYRHQGLPMDTPGFYLYVKDNGILWNPSFFPTMTRLDYYTCRHGMWHSTFEAEKAGLALAMRFFIPLKEEIMLWDITLENKSGAEKRFHLYPYVDFAAHDALKDIAYFRVAGLQQSCDCEPGLGIMTDYHCYQAVYTGSTLFCASEPFSDFDTDRNLFIGRGRCEVNPLGLECGLQNSRVSNGGTHTCGTFELPIWLRSGEKKRVMVKLITATDKDVLQKLSLKYNDIAVVDQAAAAQEKRWNDLLARCQVATPDANADIMINTWLPKNFFTTMRCGRSISHRHPGMGSGVHFRDTMQDIMPGIMFDPDGIKSWMHLLYRSVKASGKITYSIHPTTFTCPNPLHNRCDAAVWGVFTLYKYLAETQNLDFLNEVVPYYDEGTGTILEHQLRAMHSIGENIGSHGLPMLFDCDWNDGLVVFSGARGGGESIMVAEQFIYAANLLKEILEVAGRMEEWPFFDRKIQDFTTILASDICWDGQWYKRVLYPDMELGSKTNKEARIFLNSQSWAVMAGTLPKEQLEIAMKSVADELDTPYGIRICTPSLTTLIDGVTRFPANNPGAGENGGLFLHANTWAIIAETMLHHPQQAWKYFSQILPANLAANAPDLYAREPYAFSSWIYGPEHKDFGKSDLTWLTGGAAWIYLTGLEYILGIRPTLKGLTIDPCFPEAWPGFSIYRQYRNTGCEIEVVNRSGKGYGKVQVTVNGKPMKGNTIPTAELEAHNHCKIQVLLV